MKKTVHVVDYGLSNVNSLKNALEYIGVDVILAKTPDSLSGSKKIIIPGVGSFARAILRLRSLGLEDAILDSVKARNSSVLGICLGMQLLAEMSTENGTSTGLGLISGNVTRFSLEDGARYVQNVGFNQLEWTKNSVLSSGLPETAPFYFTHSYKLETTYKEEMAAKTYNGTPFVSVIDNGENVFGTQFHPEKSQKFGLQLLRNFASHD
jgi:glutamine amidotransferase